MPSPLYRLLTTHLPLRGQTSAKTQQLVDDLRSWEFDPNETHLECPKGWRIAQPLSLLQAFVDGLPRQLSGADLSMVEDVVDILLAKGANPHVVDRFGQPVEELAPAFLRERLIRARGGDLERDRQVQYLSEVCTRTMRLKTAVATLETQQGTDGVRTAYLGHPLALWILAHGFLWADAGVENDGPTMLGEATIAQHHSAHVRQVLRACPSLSSEQRQLAEFLGWCLASAQCKTDGSRGEHWDKLADKLEGKGHEHRLAHAQRVLNQGWGDLTGPVGQTIALACVDFGDDCAVSLWAQGLQRLYDCPGPLDKQPRATLSTDVFLLPYAWHGLVLPRIRRGAPTPGSMEAQAWLDHLPAPLGTTLVMNGLQISHQGTSTSSEQAQQAWLEWAIEWLDHHPDQAPALKDHVGHASYRLPNEVVSTLRANLMEHTLPSTVKKGVKLRL